MVPLELRDAPVALALPGIYRVFSVPGFKEGSVFVGDDAAPWIGLLHIEINPGNVATNLRPGLNFALGNLDITEAELPRFPLDSGWGQSSV
jgi:hypothetical protein